MKARFPKLVRFLSILFLAVWAVGPQPWAQTPPQLGIQIVAGLPTLILTGSDGTVYSIQYASDLSQTNVWIDRTLLQAHGGGTDWTDPSAPSTGQRFYRAVSVAPPGDTNLVFIQPGTFTMGSPTTEEARSEDEIQHTARISRGFWMGKYLVTQREYLAVTGMNPSYFQGDLARPVEQMGWNDATNYCALRTQQEAADGRIPTNCVYRLPTESEWEFACRAGTSTRYSYGDDPGYINFSTYAWYHDNSGNTTHPVGQKLPNSWGLYDMHGSLLEWCWDFYGDYPTESVTDPQGAVGDMHVSRGGGYYYFPWNCRSAQRFPDHVPVGVLFSVLGFRVVLAP